MTATPKKPHKERAEELLQLAVSLAEGTGYMKVTRKQIADKAGVCEALVTHRLGTMAAVRRSVIRRAIATQNVRVLAQGLAANDPHARKAPDDLKQQAAQWLAR